MKPAHLVSRTANSEPLHVRGQVELTLTIAGRNFTEDFIVSDDVCNCLLSLAWLKRNGGIWDFNSDILILNGVPVRLRTLDDRTACTRRIQVAVDTSMPARQTTHSDSFKT